jgi:hypothetical protein
MEREKKFSGVLRRNERQNLMISRIQFEVPNFHFVFHDPDFKPNTKVWIKNIYIPLPTSRFNTEDTNRRTSYETKNAIFFVILMYLYSSLRIQSKAEALEARPNESAYCSLLAFNSSLV